MKVHPIKTKVFSDNILMYSEGIIDIWQIIAYAAIFQIRALYNGLIVRGGISCGSFYENATFVYGKGLCNAVFLEEQISVFPRIIVDNQIITSDKDIKDLFCIKDTDGYYYLDFYSFSLNVIYSDVNTICSELKIRL